MDRESENIFKDFLSILKMGKYKLKSFQKGVYNSLFLLIA